MRGKAWTMADQSELRIFAHRGASPTEMMVKLKRSELSIISRMKRGTLFHIWSSVREKRDGQQKS